VPEDFRFSLLGELLPNDKSADTRRGLVDETRVSASATGS
jgi:hypothetical protein